MSSSIQRFFLFLQPTVVIETKETVTETTQLEKIETKPKIELPEEILDLQEKCRSKIKSYSFNLRKILGEDYKYWVKDNLVKIKIPNEMVTNKRNYNTIVNRFFKI